jgi:hypothetical protein
MLAAAKDTGLEETRQMRLEGTSSPVGRAQEPLDQVELLSRWGRPLVHLLVLSQVVQAFLTSLQQVNVGLPRFLLWAAN